MRYLFWLFFLGASILSAQQPDTEELLPDVVETLPQEELQLPEQETFYTPPPARPVALRSVEDQQWSKAINGLDYSKDVPEKKEEEKKDFDTPNPFTGFNWAGLGSWLGVLLQVLAIAAAIVGIAYAIYRTMNAPRNRQIARDGVEITLDNVEQYIHESDLDRFLREALAAGNYPLAIRLYYLQVIKQLSETGAIRWSREKTNRDYLRETRMHRSADAFRKVTRVYERVWYGNQVLDAAAYEQLEPDFKNLLGSI